MDPREIKEIIKEYTLILCNLVYHSILGLKYLTKGIKKQPVKREFKPVQRVIPKKPSKLNTITKETTKGINAALKITLNGLNTGTKMFLGGLTIFIKKYLHTAINYIAKGVFTILHITGKKTGKGLDTLTEKVHTEIKKHKPSPRVNLKYMEDIVKINMIAVPIYLFSLIVLFIIWSLTNKLSQVTVETIYLIIPLLLTLCIPFFSFYNFLKRESFSITDLILNIIFIVIVLVSLTMFIIYLF